MGKLLRVAVVAAALVGLATLPPSPAHAATKATALVTGSMTTGQFGWPALHPPNVTGFQMGTFTCAGTKVDLLSETKPDGSYGPICDMRAAGVVAGNCGLMTGTGTGIITFSSPTKTASFNFTFNVYGTTMEMTGVSHKGRFAGSVQLTEDPSSPGDCLRGTETGFIFGGGVSITTP